MTVERKDKIELWTELAPEQWLQHEYPKIREACTQAKVSMICSMGYSAEEIAEMAPKVAPFANGFELSTHYIGDSMKPMENAIKAAIIGGGWKPVYVKLHPFRDVAKAAFAMGVTGIVAVNSYGSTMAFNIDRMGKPFMDIHDICKEIDLPVIGVGGISTGRDAIEFMMAGASACGIRTAATVNGRDVYGRIAAEMTAWMQQHGIKEIGGIVGMAPRQPTFEQINQPSINESKCVGCNTCVTSCLYEATQLNESGNAVVDPKKCFRCGL